MIGIDIIDIAETRKTTNWQRPRFLEKLFTLKEQELIRRSKNVFITVWHLWSMKEAAYKLYTQTHAERFYNPKQFQCDIYTPHLKVTYKEFECFVATKITNAYILSEASAVKKPISSDVIPLTSQDYRTQSKTTKQALISSVSTQLNLMESKLEILKSSIGKPLLYYNSKISTIEISLSHHGYYGAFGFTPYVL